MALALNDRVQQQGTANTTVSFTLGATVPGFQSFAVIGNGNTTYYSATDASFNWEVGIGTYSTSGSTLTRTTILSSSNSGSAETFVGDVNVFVTYPSEKSVNLDASGNVSALGTVSSGTWNGTTVGVAYGGTGVTASTGANSVVLRDADENIVVNSVTQELTKTVSAGGTTTLTAASSHFQVLTGTLAQTYKLPDATSLPTGSTWVFDNDSTQNLTIQDNALATIDVVPQGGYTTVFLEANGTVAGEWGRFGMLPNEVNWGTNSLALASTVISGGTWQGGTIASGYGGTGLTTFTAANNALYSTSGSALAAGTLPVLAGGTGVTTSTGSGNVVLSTSPTLVTPVLGTPSSGTLTSCTGYTTANLSGSIDLGSQVSGTLPIANGGTNSTATATAGGIGYGTGTAHAYTTAGTSGQVLTSAGASAPTWTTPTTGTVTSVTGTAPVVSSGGATPAISMAAATTSVSGYLTSTDWNTFNGKTSNTGTVTSVSGTGTVSGLTLTGTVTSSGSLTLGGTIDTLNQNTTGSSGSCTGNSATATTATNLSGGTVAATTITATGNITAYYSDDRLKTNFGNIPNALFKVNTLNGFYYEANETAQALGYKPVREVGVSAQQVQAILPEITAPAPIDNKYLTVHYERLVPLLIEAIKELTAKVEALEAR